MGSQQATFGGTGGDAGHTRLDHGPFCPLSQNHITDIASFLVGCRSPTGAAATKDIGPQRYLRSKRPRRTNRQGTSTRRPCHWQQRKPNPQPATWSARATVPPTTASAVMGLTSSSSHIGPPQPRQAPSGERRPQPPGLLSGRAQA